MRKCHFAIFVVILTAVCCSAQDSTLACDIEGLLPADPAVPSSTPVGRILDGDQCAIAAAGNSKDPRYIPYLKKIEKSNHEHSGDYHSNSAEFAQMALAKLGVEQDLFEIECEIQPKASKYVRLYAIEDKLAYVGGWFAIHLATEMLPDNEQNKENLSYGDALIAEWHPRKLAITMLPRILGRDSEPFERFGRAEPGFEKFKGLTEEQVIDGWYHWILDHENELKNLEPTGDAVHYSEERCDKYLKGQGALVQSKSRKQ